LNQKTCFTIIADELVIISGIQFLTDTGIYPWPEADLLRRMQAFPGLVEAILKAQPGSFGFMLNNLAN